MRQRAMHCFVAVFGVFATVVPTQAEFPSGAMLPDFALPAIDGKTTNLARSEGTLQLSRDGEVQRPAALAMHLLQPDCLQCRAQLMALQALSTQFQGKAVVVMGVSHRGSMDDLKKLGEDLGLTFPLLMGVGSELAKQFAAGDAFAIVDRSGKVQYSQAGFGKGDEALWAAAIEELLAGKSVSKPTVARERLAVGDRFPAVELPSLLSGKNMGLIGRNGRLVFRDEQGVEQERKGAVGFFSRY